MKTNTNEIKTPKQASDEYLEEMAAFVNATYGAKKSMADALSARTGEDVARERIERWLHRDPEQRQQPLLGSALLLREVFSEVKQKLKTKTREVNEHDTNNEIQAAPVREVSSRTDGGRARGTNQRHKRQRPSLSDHPVGRRNPRRQVPAEGLS
jgi:hypothetical protein